MSFAGVSFISGGGLLTPSTPATATAVTDSGYHLLVVDGYSRTKESTPNGDCVKSPPFRVGGHQWRIRYYPNGRKPEVADYISLHLLLDDDNVAETVKVQFRFCFIDKADKQLPSNIHEIEVTNFSNKSLSWGYNTFMKRDELEKSAHLKDDSLIIKCDIVVIKDVHLRTTGANTVPLMVLPASDMHQHFTRLLQSREGTDVIFEVCGEKLHAHRCVLAARSAVFRAQLFGPMKEGTTTGVIRIDDMEARVFKLMLTFIYSDTMPDINEEEDTQEKDGDVVDVEVMWQHLLVAADRYDLQRLRLMCEIKLCGYINATKVASILELAQQHHCRGLREACLDFLNFRRNLQQVMEAGGLNHLSSSCPSVLIDLIAKLAYLKPDD